MKPCRTCKWVIPVDDSDSDGYCHVSPPTALSSTSSTYSAVGLDKPGCSLHREVSMVDAMNKTPSGMKWNDYLMEYEPVSRD